MRGGGGGQAKHGLQWTIAGNWEDANGHFHSLSGGQNADGRISSSGSLSERLTAARPTQSVDKIKETRSMIRL